MRAEGGRERVRSEGGSEGRGMERGELIGIARNDTPDGSYATLFSPLPGHHV